MNRSDIDFSSIVEFLEKIYNQCKKRTSSEKTRNSHDSKPHFHITLQIHIEKQEKWGSYTRKEYYKNNEKINMFCHKKWIVWNKILFTIKIFIFKVSWKDLPILFCSMVYILIPLDLQVRYFLYEFVSIFWRFVLLLQPYDESDDCVILLKLWQISRNWDEQSLLVLSFSQVP